MEQKFVFDDKRASMVAAYVAVMIPYMYYIGINSEDLNLLHKFFNFYIFPILNHLIVYKICELKNKKIFFDKCFELGGYTMIYFYLTVVIAFVSFYCTIYYFNVFTPFIMYTKSISYIIFSLLSFIVFKITLTKLRNKYRSLDLKDIMKRDLGELHSQYLDSILNT